MPYYLIVTSQAILDEIGYTPDIEGGIGPVMLGVPIKSTDGRLAVHHHWTEADKAWLETYIADLAGCSVQEELPADFVVEVVE